MTQSRHGVGRKILVGVVMLIVALNGSCREKPAPPSGVADPEPVSVRLVAVEQRPVDRFIEVTGTLYGEEEVSVSAKVAGRVLTVDADLGDLVEPGALLAAIDPTDYQLAVDEEEAALLAALAKVGLAELPEGEIDLSSVPLVARAEAEELNARARLDRARRLFERTPPLISEQDFADIQTQHAVASTSAGVERMNANSLLAEANARASALRTARQRLADTRVVAPSVRGLTFRVASRMTSTGEIVGDGQVMFRLVSMERVKFRGMVPERHAADVRVGARAELMLDAFEASFEATVSRVSPGVDVATRSFEIEVLAENADGRLKPGSFVRARLHVATDPSAQFVPESAVSQFAGVQRVYSVRDGAVIEHRVRLGEASGGFREVLEPIDGVAYVIDEPRGMRAGLPIRVE